MVSFGQHSKIRCLFSGEFLIYLFNHIVILGACIYNNFSFPQQDQSPKGYYVTPPPPPKYATQPAGYTFHTLPPFTFPALAPVYPPTYVTPPTYPTPPPTPAPKYALSPPNYGVANAGLPPLQPVNLVSHSHHIKNLSPYPPLNIAAADTADVSAIPAHADANASTISIPAHTNTPADAAVDIRVRASSGNCS